MHNLTAQDITEIQKLLEKDVFKAADQAELDRRQKDYAEIQRKEDARIRKEREKEIKALGLTPAYKKIKELIPVVRKLWDEYADDQADWMGNYSEVDGYDAPTKISFNIKIYGVSLPDGVQDKIDELNLQDASNNEFDTFMTDSAEAFIDELKEEYDFITEVYGAGRSGGWLVIEVDTISPEDMDAVFEAFDKQDVTDEDWFTRKGMQDAYNILKNMKRDLEKRIQAYYEIEKKVELGKKGVTATLSSKEFWDSFFEAFDETPKEEENLTIKNEHIGEAWKDHPDPSGFMRAAHDAKNALLIWWYNIKTSEFRKTDQTDARHSDDQDFILNANLKEWVRGRVFKYQNKVYLIIYMSDRKYLSPAMITDIMDLAQDKVKETITRAIDDDGNVINELGESQKTYQLETSKLGAWKIDETGVVRECVTQITE